MRTSILMAASAIVMFIVGLGLTFLPEEILVYLEVDPQSITKLLAQIAGAMYLGFAMINWTARYNLIGGIYSRPVAIGNFAHFLIVSLALVRFVFGDHGRPLLTIAAAFYLIFAIWFAIILFTHPIKADPAK